MDRYEYLRPYAETERQTEVLDVLRESETNAAAAKWLGISERNVMRLIQRLKEQAAARGIAPDQDMTHETAEGFVVKGTSTLYGEDGDVKAQWVKTQQGPAQTLSQLREAIAEAMDGYKGVYRPRKAPKSDTSELLACYVMGDPTLAVMPMPRKPAKTLTSR